MLSLSIIAAAAIRTAYDFSARDGSMWISDGSATLEFIAKGASWFGGETEVSNTISSCRWKKCTGCSACG